MSANLFALLPVTLGYLLGSVSGSLILGRLRGVDIRTQGSGNAGGTNAFRTQGWRFALSVVLVDIGKGALAAALGLWLWREGMRLSAVELAACSAAAAVLGHTWPVFFGFRGGKGAGTLVGTLAVIWPLAVLPLFVLWLLVLTASGYVGLATVCAGLLLPLLALLWAEPPWTMAFAVFAATFLLFTHRSNLLRLRQGNENRFERVRIWHRAWKHLGARSG
jgi:glycerol-3-phosphate acyltransferase PlsY